MYNQGAGFLLQRNYPIAGLAQRVANGGKRFMNGDRCSGTGNRISHIANAATCSGSTSARKDIVLRTTTKIEETPQERIMNR